MAVGSGPAGGFAEESRAMIRTCLGVIVVLGG